MLPSAEPPSGLRVPEGNIGEPVLIFGLIYVFHFRVTSVRRTRHADRNVTAIVTVQLDDLLASMVSARTRARDRVVCELTVISVD